MKEYKVVPGPMNIVVDKNNQEAAFNRFGDLINQHCVDGWQYHSMETIAVTESGCMNNTTVNYYMLIFEREADEWSN